MDLIRSVDVTQFWIWVHGAWIIYGKPLSSKLAKLWLWAKRKWQGRRRNVRTTNFCPELVDDFERRAKSLEPSSKYLKKGRSFAHTVYTTLQGSCNYVNRMTIAGSTGKGTGISYEEHRSNGSKIRRNPDFDIVIFINIREPPFINVLAEFKSAIETIPGIAGPVMTSRYSVQFTFYDQSVGNIEFDLLPAQNLVEHRFLQRNVGDAEAENALELVRNRHKESIQKYQNLSPADNKLHSAAFCERTVDIIGSRLESTSETKFYQKVVRLAKYWNSQIQIDSSHRVPSRSCMIELIAICCQRGKPKRCLIGGFRRFLEQMRQLNILVVQIGKNDEDETNDEIREIMNVFRENATWPIIVDPANPYNNLALGMDQTAVKIFMRQASETIKLLESVKQSSRYTSVENVIDRIFSHK